MIIAFIFILAGIIFMIGTLIYTRKKNNLQDTNTANINKGKKTLKTLFGISKIKNQVITTYNKQHSIIVE